MWEEWEVMWRVRKPRCNAHSKQLIFIGLHSSVWPDLPPDTATRTPWHPARHTSQAHCCRRDWTVQRSRTRHMMSQTRLNGSLHTKHWKQAAGTPSIVKHLVKHEWMTRGHSTGQVTSTSQCVHIGVRVSVLACGQSVHSWDTYTNLRDYNVHGCVSWLSPVHI